MLKSEKNSRIIRIVLYEIGLPMLGFVSIHWLAAGACFLKTLTSEIEYLGLLVTPPEGLKAMAVKGAMVTHLLYIPMIGLLLSSLYHLAKRLWSMPKEEESAWKRIFVGTGLYLFCNALVVLTYPGMLAEVPVLYHLPFMVNLMLILLYIGFFTVWIPDKWPVKVTFFAFLIALGFLPHDLTRGMSSRNNQLDFQTDRVIVIVLDAVRFDAFRDILIKRSFEPGQLRLGFSQMEATRKQYRILMGDPVEHLSGEFIWPLDVIEGPTPAHRPPPFSPSRPVALLLDDGSTLNHRSLRDFQGYLAISNPRPWHAINWPRFCPFLSIVENWFSPMETTNRVSDLSTLYRYAKRTALSQPITILHTVRLTTPPSTWGELSNLFGKDWMFGSSNFSQRPVAQGGQEALYRYRLEKLVSFAMDWSRAFLREYPNTSILITSDHGQCFFAGPDSPIPTAGHHGYFFSPDCAWIPFFALGKTRFEGPPSALLTWAGLREALRRFSRDGGVLTISGNLEPQHARSTFILHPSIQGKRSLYAKDVLDIPTLARFFRVNAEGIYIDTRIHDRSSSTSEVWAFPGARLVTLNPSIYGGEIQQSWNLYKMVIEEHFSDLARR